MSQSHLFVSYKSEENRFALKLAADLRNRGIGIWVDRLDGGIETGDKWAQTLDAALKNAKGLIIVLTPEYFESHVCRAELEFAFGANLPLFPLMLRKTPDLPFFLQQTQYQDFTGWLDEKEYQAQLEKLFHRIQREERAVMGAIPDAEVQYLTTLIADLESQQGVENYITLAGQAEIERRNPRTEKRIDPSLALLLENKSRPDDFAPRPTEPIADIHEAVTKYPKFVLIGDPGAGKTTTLRRLALEDTRARLEWHASPNNNPPPLPFLVYLPRWSNEPDAPAFVRNQWELGGDILREMQAGRVHLYLDGLNEMSGEGPRKAKLLSEWLNGSTSPKSVIVTCRQADYAGDFKLGDLPTVCVEPLTDDKIREFAVQYLGENAVAPFLEKIMPEYEDEEQKKRLEKHSLLHLARNPYLLAALTMVNEVSGDLPTNTGALFKRLVTVLWERERLRQAPCWVPFEEMQQAFGQLAFSMIENRIALSVSVDYASYMMGSNSLFPCGQSANILVIDEEGLRFSHQLMLEYFAAIKLDQLELSKVISEPLIYNGRAPTKWDESIIALFGISKEPNALFKQLMEIDFYLAAQCIESGIDIAPENQLALITHLDNRLDGEIWYVCAGIADALGLIGDPRVVPVLLKIIQGDSRAQYEAERALRKLNEVALPHIFNALSSHEVKHRVAAATALAAIRNPQTINALLDAIQDENQEVRDEIFRALWLIQDQTKAVSTVIPTLLEVLQYGSVDMRKNAAKLIGKIGDSEAVPSLIKALKDEDAEVRRTVAETLGWRFKDSRTVPHLIVTLQDTHPNVQVAAAEALHYIGDLQAIPHLIEVLKSEDVRLRSTAAVAIPAITTEYPLNAIREDTVLINYLKHWAFDDTIGLNFTEKMKNALDDESPEIRYFAIWALGEIGIAYAIPTLIDIYKNDEFELRCFSIYALGRIADSQCLPYIIDALESDNPVMRYWAAITICTMQEPKTTPNLIGVLNDPSVAVRHFAALALGRLRSPEAASPLIKRLSDNEIYYDERICDTAAEALEKIGTPEALEAVRRWQAEQGQSE